MKFFAIQTIFRRYIHAPNEAIVQIGRNVRLIPIERIYVKAGGQVGTI